MTKEKTLEILEKFIICHKIKYDDCVSIYNFKCGKCPWHITRDEADEAIIEAIETMKNIPTQMSGTSDKENKRITKTHYPNLDLIENTFVNVIKTSE